MPTRSEIDSARARARAKEANKRNEEFDRKARRQGVQERTIRSLQDKGKLATLFDRASTSPSEREAREDKRVSDLKTGRTRAGERILAERGKKRDAETKARVARAAQADIDRRSAASGAKLEAKMNREAENARKLKGAKKTQKAVADFTGESGKRARLSDAKRRADANKTITMSPEDFAKVPSVPPAKKKPVTKRMTEAEVRAMKSSPLNTKKKAKSQGGTAPGIMTKNAGVTAKPKAKVAAKPAAKPATKTTTKPTTKTWKDVKSVAAAKAAGLKNYTGRDGKKKAAIDASEIKKGESMTQAFNRIQGKTARKPSSTTKPTTNTTTKTPKKVGGLRRFLLGPDGEFGGARGAIDFFPGKSRPKKEEKPVKKNMGGMMKSKMSSKGGARGGRNPMGMKNGGFPDLNKDGKVTQADVLQGRGVVKKKAGGMAKKGYAKGGMTKKGYANGGAVNKTASRKPTKPRGVGVAKRGFGKAMR